MPKALITHALLSTVVCPPGKVKLDLYDTIIRGLVAEISQSGRITLALRYVAPDGKQKQFKIGRFGEITVAAARKRAQQLRSEVVMGGDPGAKKAEAKAVPLYREIAAQHLTYAKLHLKSYDDVESIMRCHLLPRWGKMRVSDITRTAVSQWLSDKRGSGLSPATVEKLRVTLGRSFELAAQEAVLGCDKNPTKGIFRKPLNNARTRFLSSEEASRLRLSASESKNPQLFAIVSLLLFTGVRMRELLDAKWANVDIERRSWHIPTSKNGRSRHVPLSTPAVEIIQTLPRFSGCGWLIPNPDTKQPFVSIKHAWQHAIKRARLPGLRIHDLRHSAASFMIAANIDLYTVGKILGHVNYQSTTRYSHVASDALLKAVEAGAAKQAG